MPRVRLTYDKDIAREGTDVLDVSEGRAQVLLNLRRAVILPDVEPPAEPTPAVRKRTRKTK